MFEKVCERNCLIFNVKWSIKLTTNIAIEKMHRDQGAESMRLRRSLHTNGRSGRFLVDVAMSSWSQDLPSVGAPSWDGASWWTQPWADDLRACPLWGLHHGMVLPGGHSHEQMITGLALCGNPIMEFPTQIDEGRKIITMFYLCAFHMDSILKSHHNSDVMGVCTQREASTGKNHSMFYYRNCLCVLNRSAVSYSLQPHGL